MIKLLNKNFKTTFLCGVTLLGSSSALARNLQASGTGIVFPSPNQALSVNAVGLKSANGPTIESLYFFDKQYKKNGHLSLASSRGPLGIGLAARSKGGATIYEAGLGLGMGFLDLGMSIRNMDSKPGINGDASILLHLPLLKWAFVARGLNGAIDRIDGGVGFRIAFFTFEVNAKKTNPLKDSRWLFSTGAALNLPRVSIGAGYDTSYVDKQKQQGEGFASLTMGLTRAMHLEVFYRPLAQEWQTSPWVAGVRLDF